MNRALDSQELLQGLIRWSLAHMPRILLLVLLAIFVSQGGRRILRRFQQRLQAQDLESGRTAQRSVTLAAVLGNLLIAIVWSIAVMQILAELGIDVGPVLAGAGIAGVALGFGAQSLVRDFLTGFFVLLEDQYRVGDTVEVENATGVVEHFTLRLTSIRALDGSLHHVSNGQINKIKNSSAGWARAIVDIRASHNEKLSKLTEALERAGDELAGDDQAKDLVVERPRVMGVEDFSSSQVAGGSLHTSWPAATGGEGLSREGEVGIRGNGHRPRRAAIGAHSSAWVLNRRSSRWPNGGERRSCSLGRECGGKSTSSDVFS